MRAFLVAAVAVVACGCVPEPAKHPGERKIEDGVPVRQVVELYRANPAKAFDLYEKKFTKMTGIVPLTILASPIRTKVFDVRCTVGDGKDQYDFLMFCVQDEAKGLDVGKVCNLELSLFNDPSPDGRPVFYTRGRAQGDAGEARP